MNIVSLLLLLLLLLTLLSLLTCLAQSRSVGELVHHATLGSAEQAPPSVRVYIYIYIYIYISFIHTYTIVHVIIVSLYTYVCVYVCMYVYIYIYTYTHYMYVYICMHINTYTGCRHIGMKFMTSEILRAVPTSWHPKSVRAVARLLQGVASACRSF